MLVFGLKALAVRPRAEDVHLRGKFGEEWEQYARRVRWWLIPGVI